MPGFHILSFDGGGVRGALMLALLVRLDGLVPAWRSRVDLYAGTSAGALIALGLAAGFEPVELLQRFRDGMGRVFRDSWWDDVLDLGTALGADYDGDPLRAETEGLFGGRTLGDLQGRVLVPALHLDAPEGARPKFFHNLPGSDSDSGRLVADVARYSASAPVFFPASDGFADGGLVANHPGMAAVALTRDERVDLPRRPSLRDIRLLSIGSGADPVRIPPGSHDWGWIRWAKPLIRMLVESTVAVPDYQCRQLLGSRYHRLVPTFPDDDAPAIDDVGAVAALERHALAGMRTEVTAAAEWLRRSWIGADAA